MPRSIIDRRQPDDDPQDMEHARRWVIPRPYRHHPGPRSPHVIDFLILLGAIAAGAGLPPGLSSTGSGASNDLRPAREFPHPGADRVPARCAVTTRERAADILHKALTAIMMPLTSATPELVADLRENRQEHHT
jgi:hypothetical protein